MRSDVDFGPITPTATMDVMVRIDRSNTILYCARWADVVAFYREGLELEIAFENDWFVEFVTAPGAFLSVADAARSSIDAGEGAGLTLSWRVTDVAAERSRLQARSIDVGEIAIRWGAHVVDLFDPAGNRVELWSDPG